MFWHQACIIEKDMKGIRILYLFTLILLGGQAFAEFYYIVGGITPHYQRPDGVSRKLFCNDLGNNSGVIYNELNSFRYEEKNHSYGLLVGENSYCSPIWGATYSYNILKTDTITSALTAGFYHFDQEGFDFSEGAYFGQIGNFFFVPIVGVEVNVKLYSNKDFKIQLMNLVTPVLSNHSLGIVFNY